MKLTEPDLVKNYVESCTTAQLLIDDLRLVSNYLGVSNVKDLEEYGWFKQHFGGGFSLDAKLRSSRSGTNELGSNLGFNIRNVIQDQGLGLGKSTRGGSIDIFSLGAKGVIDELGDKDFSSKHFNKNSKWPLTLEHTETVMSLRNLVIDRVLQSNGLGSLKETVSFFALNHLAAIITKDEEKASKTRDKSNQYQRQPFRRYVFAGARIMISTGLEGPDRYLDVTASTRQEIEAIRSRNPRWKSLIHGIQSFDYSQMPSHMAQTRALFHNDSLSTKHPGVRSSGFYPELTEENLEIIARNDLVELCRKFYTWKIK